MSLFDQDDAPGVMDEVSLHGRGRLGTVLRWNPKTRQRSLDQLVWGLLPHDSKNPANGVRPIMARAETLAEHPQFASAFRHRRAIVPMSVYYQRRTIGGAEQRFAISRTDGQPMAVAGLWESFRRPDGTIDRTYCIITTEANALVAPIHDRMLVVLEKEDWPVWLGEQPGDPSLLLRPPELEILQCKPTGDGQLGPRRRRL
jgi:putative SOS response-associated peptidase YedK